MQNSLLCEVAGKGLAKLLLSGRMASEKLLAKVLLAKLLILWLKSLPYMKHMASCRKRKLYLRDPNVDIPRRTNVQISPPLDSKSK